MYAHVSLPVGLAAWLTTKYPLPLIAKSVEEDEDEIDYDAEEDKKHPGAPETVDFDKMKKENEIVVIMG